MVILLLNPESAHRPLRSAGRFDIAALHRKAIMPVRA